MNEKIKEVKFENKPDPELIEMLERWLERAKNGEITGVGIAGTLNDGAIRTEFHAGNYSHVLLNSAIYALFMRYGKNFTE